MLQYIDNPGQEDRGGQEYGEGSFNQSQRTQDSQHDETTPKEGQLKEQNRHNIPTEDKQEDKFSPGEAEDYNPDDFATD